MLTTRLTNRASAPPKGSLRREWVAFRRPGRLIALALAALAMIGLGLLTASGMHSSCDGPCPTDPIGPDGTTTVADHFYFAHRDLGSSGSITVRLTSMDGTITYPPPNHDSIVSGLVPWAKTGIIIKDGIRPGSSYAAMMMTGSHGVRMQYDYKHDIAGRVAGVGPKSPVWLRLDRSGDTITGYESTDGAHWSAVGTARLLGLPETVQVGMFAASPGDLTLRPVALGGAIEEVRFTQATGVFDQVKLTGAADGAWNKASIGGEMNHTDWEKSHNPSGVVEKDGTIRISATGDIGPVGLEHGVGVKEVLLGLIVALIIVVVVGAHFGSARSRDGKNASNDQRATDGQPATDGQSATRGQPGSLAAMAIVLGGAVFVTSLIAVGLAVTLGLALMKNNGIPLEPLAAAAGIRIVVGLAVALALSAVLALALGAVLRRRLVATSVALLVIAVPYAVASLPLLPDAVSQWLLRISPAAGFAVQQTLVEYPQVIAHYAPSAGYLPLSWPAGLAVLAAYTVAALYLAQRRARAVNPSA